VRTADGVFPAEGIFPGGRAEFLLQQDPPNHTRLRRLVSKAFSPRAIARLHSKVKEFSEDLINRVADRGEMDIIADLALPVPSLAICEMMGVPFADRDEFAVWTAEATQLLAALVWAPEMAERGLAAAEKLHAYFDRLIGDRRHRLGDDILSELIRAEEAGDRLTQTELLAQCRGLLIAGFETTVGLIGNGMLALLSHPAELILLQRSPDLIESAIEECLRFDGPLVLTQRYLREDAAFGGKIIPEGSQMWAMLLAANRDPSRFPNPDRFDIRRNDNEHLAFGGGSHFCLGAHLARMESRLALGALLRKLHHFRMVTTELEWSRSLFRVLSRLPIRFDGRGRSRV
jgi:cytochrome P450